MAAVIVCDGCGKRVPMVHSNGNWFKPSKWYERSDDDGMQTAWTRKCIEKIADRTNKTKVVIPL